MSWTAFGETLLRSVDGAVSEEIRLNQLTGEAHRVARALVPREIVALLDVDTAAMRLGVAFMADPLLDDEAWPFRFNVNAKDEKGEWSVWVDHPAILRELRALAAGARRTGRTQTASVDAGLFDGTTTTHLVVVRPGSPGADLGELAGIAAFVSCSPLVGFPDRLKSACARAVGIARDELRPLRGVGAAGFPPFPASDVTGDIIDTWGLLDLHGLLRAFAERTQPTLRTATPRPTRRDQESGASQLEALPPLPPADADWRVRLSDEDARAVANAVVGLSSWASGTKYVRPAPGHGPAAGPADHLATIKGDRHRAGMVVEHDRTAPPLLQFLHERRQAAWRVRNRYLVCIVANASKALLEPWQPLLDLCAIDLVSTDEIAELTGRTNLVTEELA